ncbi:MAG: hypothetical protein V8Q57_05670 [Blautia sp.]
MGMNLDIAYNSVSILSLWCFFMILGALAKRLSGSFAASILSVLFLVFRSGTAFFRFTYEHWLQGDLWQTLNENTSFIGYTTNENWGLWNFNVYLNQRHLAFGLLLVGMALWVFWDWVEAGCKREEKGQMVLQPVFYQRSLEKQMPGGCTVHRYDPWPLFFLEWGSCDRWTSDSDGICCIFRG